MRSLLPAVGVVAVALLEACAHVEEGDAVGGDAPLTETERKGPRGVDSERAGGPASRADARSRRRRAAPPATRREAGTGDRTGRGDELEGSSGRRSRDGRSPRRITEDELLVRLDARTLPDGVYEIDRSGGAGRGFFSTQQELDEFLERLNLRYDWFEVIRIGPWRIRVVRDTFFDPYRRDSGWIDIDRLDGPHGR